MLEDILVYISSLDPAVIYLTLFFFSFIENPFPPSPSDVVVIFGASLIAQTSLGYLPILLVTSLGSALGFIFMYYIGKMFGEKIIRSGKIKFITQEGISKTDIWFNKYGYKLILVNRFLPGSRSVVNFFAGIYELEPIKTFLLAGISAFLWNVFLIYLGSLLGNNIKLIDYYLTAYFKIGIVITLIIIFILVLRYYFKIKNKD
ncbi:MAG: DedA family protein [Melioribacteraceae bacterium]|nr:DedA family protein [Melioribacteraceae bacterium]